MNTIDQISIMFWVGITEHFFLLVWLVVKLLKSYSWRISARERERQEWEERARDMETTIHTMKETLKEIKAERKK